MWVFRFNMPGCLPDMEPMEFSTQDEAKRACVDAILFAADTVECENIAEDLTHSAEDANLESGEFGGILADGLYYCVVRV
tara:strand:- start:210 stop:449 length:240 start_codon:yes stop_codon:yes gene_type:complete